MQFLPIHTFTLLIFLFCTCRLEQLSVFGGEHNKPQLSLHHTAFPHNWLEVRQCSFDFIFIRLLSSQRKLVHLITIDEQLLNKLCGGSKVGDPKSCCLDLVSVPFCLMLYCSCAA